MPLKLVKLPLGIYLSKCCSTGLHKLLSSIGLFLVCFVLISCDAEEKKSEDKQPPQGGRKEIPLVREFTNE